MIARLLANRRASAAVEFAMIAQVFALLFAATADIGVVLIKRMQLDSNLAAAGNLALVNSAKVTATDGAALASKLSLVAGVDGLPVSANSRVVVNNGPTLVTTSGVATASGTASDADRCYCPTLTSGVVTWGSPTTCRSACPSGLRAGKFVYVNASRAHTPLFANYGIVHSGRISATELVQTE